MNIAFLQIPLHWESPEKNKISIEEYMENTDLNAVDLVVLPETFTTGFSMKAVHLAETMEGETVAWLVENAKKYEVIIAGSLMVREGDLVYNRFVWASPDGVEFSYDKKHLFGLGAEKELITPGEDRVSHSYKDWTINLNICYDLRFPVWMRNHKAATDLIIVVANWPSPRRNAWRSLLVARAIENQCYVLGVNRLGEDGNGLTYLGDSMLVDHTGVIIKDAKDEEGVHLVSLNKETMHAFRKKFPFLEDRDDFILK